MKHTSIKRPGLPSTTPFSTDSSAGSAGSVASTPWHTKHVSLLASHSRDDEKSGISLGSSLTKLTLMTKKSLRFSPRQEWERNNRDNMDNISEAGSFFSTDDSAMLKSSTTRGTTLDVLLTELSRKSEQAEKIFDATQLAYARMKAVDKSIAVMKVDCQKKDRVSASRQRSVEKLVSINMMLIETLDALGLQPSTDKGLSKLMIRLRADILPSIKPESDGVNSLVKTTNDDIHAVNAKLKEGLLIMSREYYSSKKSMKSVFGVYEELRSALRVIDQKNRCVFSSLLLGYVSCIRHSLCSGCVVHSHYLLYPNPYEELRSALRVIDQKNRYTIETLGGAVL